MSDAKPKRRWFRFSLRMLLLIVTLLCVWLGFKVNAARRQCEAVAAIRKAGGGIAYNYQIGLRNGEPDYISHNANASPPAPQWLRSIFGDDFFYSVVRVYIVGPTMSESDWERLAQLPEIRLLQLTDTKIIPNDSDQPRLIEDSDLSALRDLSQLQVLSIVGNNINGSGIGWLAKLKHLRVLRLKGNSSYIDDAGMGQIAKLTSLTFLHISSVGVSDTGLSRLSTLTNLTDLEIADSSISEAQMEQIGKLTGLRFLLFLRSQLSAHSLKSLQSLANLTMLNFVSSEISDDVLPFLKEMPQLKLLDLTGTKVTLDIQELKSALPNTTITGP